MSDAQLVAQINGARADLRTAQQQNAALETQVGALMAERDGAKAETVNAQAALAAEKAAHDAVVADLAAQLATSNAATEAARAARAAMADKFDALYGPVTPGAGITKQEVYMTADGASHQTLAAARRHMIALRGGAITAAAKTGQAIDPAVAADLAAHIAALDAR